MGCAQSRSENEEAVARCKERRQLVKSAIVSRNAFAAAHSAYVFSLKDLGAAFSELAQGEFHHLPSSPSRTSTSGDAVVAPPISVAAMASVRPPIDNLPPPHPPLPEFSPSPAKMQRSISMPERKRNGKFIMHNSPIDCQHAVSSPPLNVKRGKMVASENSGTNLLQILAELDEHFLKASESAHEVSKILEADRMHYHSNFSDNRGQIDYSAMVMKIITWSRSFKGLHNGENAKDDLDNEEWETLATVLDKMLAWEKKLFDEVKAGELMKIEYQRKIALLNKQKKNSASIEALEKTKAAMNHFHTRYIVDMQILDCTVSEIQHLRDNQLYPKLVALADGMSKMWGEMYKHHEGQRKLVLSLANSETTEHHYGHTSQLCRIVEEWHSHFSDLVTRQKDYIQSLNSWLKLNLILLESSLKEKVSSPPRPQQPPIQAFLYAWNENLGRLPDDLAKSAINRFLAVLNTINTLQQDEIKQKEKYLKTRKEYERKCRSFEDWYQRYSHKNVPAETDPTEGVTAQKDQVAERKFFVESLKSRLDDELEVHNKLARQVREKSLTSLNTHLPELFRDLSDFSRACFEMHSNLR